MPALDTRDNIPDPFYLRGSIDITAMDVRDADDEDGETWYKQHEGAEGGEGNWIPDPEERGWREDDAGDVACCEYEECGVREAAMQCWREEVLVWSCSLRGSR